MRPKKVRLTPATFDIASLLLVAAFAAASMSSAERATTISAHATADSVVAQRVTARDDPGGVSRKAMTPTFDRTAAAGPLDVAFRPHPTEAFASARIADASSTPPPIN